MSRCHLAVEMAQAVERPAQRGVDDLKLALAIDRVVVDQFHHGAPGERHVPVGIEPFLGHAGHQRLVQIHSRRSAEEIAQRAPDGRLLLAIPGDLQGEPAECLYLLIPITELHGAFDSSNRAWAIQLDPWLSARDRHRRSRLIVSPCVAARRIGAELLLEEIIDLLEGGRFFGRQFASKRGQLRTPGIRRITEVVVLAPTLVRPRSCMISDREWDSRGSRPANLASRIS